MACMPILTSRSLPHPFWNRFSLKIIQNLWSWGFSASWPPHLASYVTTRLTKVEGKDTSSSDGQLLSRSSHPCSCSMVKAHGVYMLVMRFSLNERSLPGIPRKQRPSSKSVKTTTSVSISTNLKPFFPPKNKFSHCFHRNLPSHFQLLVPKGWFHSFFARTWWDLMFVKEEWVFPWKEIRKDPQTEHPHVSGSICFDSSSFTAKVHWGIHCHPWDPNLAGIGMSHVLTPRVFNRKLPNQCRNVPWCQIRPNLKLFHDLGFRWLFVYNQVYSSTPRLCT